MNSRRKGKTGELDAVHALERALNVQARRGVQYKGTPDSPDVVIPLPVHIEVKRRERVNLYEAMEQAAEQCGAKIPVVMWRRNRKPWLVCVRLEDLARLAEVIVNGSPNHARGDMPDVQSGDH